MEQKLKLELIRKLLRKEGLEGFSLIELVVVVAVLAILAAISLPSFTSIKRLKLIIKNHHVPLRKLILTVFILTNHYCKLVEGLESRWHCAPMKDQHEKKEKY